MYRMTLSIDTHDRLTASFATVTLATLNLNLGSATRKFHLRPGTSDEGVITQVLKNSDYNFSRLRRGAELNRFYERGASSNKAPLIVDAGANIGDSPVYSVSYTHLTL